MENTTPKIIATKTLAKVYDITIDVYTDTDSCIITPNTQVIMFKDSLTKEEIENKIIPEMFEEFLDFKYTGTEDVNELPFDMVELDNHYESKEWYDFQVETDGSPF